MSGFDPASGLTGGVMVDANAVTDTPGSVITAALLNGIVEEQNNLVTLGGGAPAFGTNNQQATAVAAYVAAQIAAQSRSPNHFVDPCCRVAQSAAPNLSTSKQYGAVDMVQAWVSAGSVSAGTIGQDNAPGTLTGSAVHLAGVSLGVNSAISFRRWLESNDARDYIGGPAIVAATLFQNTGNDIPNVTITLNMANAANNFSATTLIAGSGNLDLPNNVLKRISFYVPNMGACGYGIEMIVTVPTGAAAVVTKDFYITDFQISPGSVLAPFEVPKFLADFEGVQRYFQKSYPYGVFAGSASTPGFVAFVAQISVTNNAAFAECSIPYKVRMLGTPSISIYSTTGAVNKLRNATGAADFSTNSSIYTSDAMISVNNESGANSPAGASFQFHFIADSRI